MTSHQLEVGNFLFTWIQRHSHGLDFQILRSEFGFGPVRDELGSAGFLDHDCLHNVGAVESGLEA